MAVWLAGDGNEVRMITSPPFYPDWKIWPGYSGLRYTKGLEDGVMVTRCPLYVPSRPNALRRIAHFVSFSISSSLALLAQWRWKPEVIILVVPTMFCAPQTLLLAKLTGAKSVLHVQDYEVDLLFGLGFFKRKGFRGFFLGLERAIVRSFDLVSTISIGMLERAEQKGVKRASLRFFPNWSEVSRFQKITRSPDLLKRLRVDPSKQLILYAGNMGEKQGLDIIIEVAALLRRRESWQFLIVGDGADKARLLALVGERQLSNLHVASVQPYEDLPALLASADCHLVVQKRGVAESVLPSKLTNILAVGGNAVITADADTSLGKLCEEHPGIAVLVNPESAEALAEGITRAMTMPIPNLIASEYARKHLDKDQIMSRFVAELRTNF